MSFFGCKWQKIVALGKIVHEFESDFYQFFQNAHTFWTKFDLYDHSVIFLRRGTELATITPIIKLTVEPVSSFYDIHRGLVDFKE